MSEARALYAPEWLTYPEHPETLSRTIWTDSFTRDEQGELCIDGVTVSDLVAEHETPQYVFSCLLYTSPSPRDRQKYRMPSSA